MIIYFLCGFVKNEVFSEKSGSNSLLTPIGLYHAQMILRKERRWLRVSRINVVYMRFVIEGAKILIIFFTLTVSDNGETISQTQRTSWTLLQTLYFTAIIVVILLTFCNFKHYNHTSVYKNKR